MKLSPLVLGLVLLGSATAATASIKSVKDPHAAERVTRQGKHLIYQGEHFRFSGCNMYWLGLDQNVPPGVVAYPTKFRVRDAFQTATAMGARVVRAHTLGISTGNPLSYEPSLNHFNDDALEPIDYAVKVAGEYNMKLVVPLTDNWHYYEGGKHSFTDWYHVPEAEFYSNPLVIAAYKNYVTHLLNHTNRYTGVRYGDDPTILAWETGNELMPPANWTADIAQFLKRISPNVLVLSGRDGVNPEELTITEVDMYSDHFYPPVDQRATADALLTGEAEKVLFLGEFGWTYNNSLVHDFLHLVLNNPNISGANYWSLFPHLDSYGYVQHGDGFTLHYPGEQFPSNWRYSRQIELSEFAWAMSGKGTRHGQPPRFNVTQAPLLHAVNSAQPPSLGTRESREEKVTSLLGDHAGMINITWRGSAGACRYKLTAFEKANPSNTKVLSGDAQDDKLPFWTPAPSGTSTWCYSVVPYNCFYDAPGPESNHECWTPSGGGKL